MYAVDQSEKSEPEMPSNKNQARSIKQRIPDLRLVPAPPGSDAFPAGNCRAICQRIADGTYTLGESYFFGVEKPEDAERRFLNIIERALDADDTTVQHTMLLLRREFDLDDHDSAVWIYFRVLENLWAKLSEDVRSRHFFHGRGAVTEH